MTLTPENSDLFFHGCSALAPMQDVTTLDFMRLITRYGAPDLFFTEYFRVHEHSRPERHILASITENPSDKPVFAQLIGEDLVHLRRTVEALRNTPIAGIDLNLGCPAPKVYRKNVGGGLLRDPEKISDILGVLRDATPNCLTVKMRIGFEDDRFFDRILELMRLHRVELLSLHARTVKGLYRSPVDYRYIKRAAESLPCPVLANGEISTTERALRVLNETGCRGVMIGRGAIRNPWIFRQIRESLQGQPHFQPTLSDVRSYVDDLREAVNSGNNLDDRQIASRLKKFLNFVGQGVDPEGAFLKEMRRAKDLTAFLSICDRHLINNGRADKYFSPEPYAGLVARPNAESAKARETQRLPACTL